MIYAWKLFRKRRDGSLGPLFINRKMRIQTDKWLTAKSFPTKGFALRPGWHATLRKSAPHLRTTGKDRVWVRVQIDRFSLYKRPRSQGGTWALARKMRVCGADANK